MHHTSAPADPARGPAVPVRIHRIEPGEIAWVLSLDPTYGGLFTHWVRGRSEVCEGEDCPSSWHNGQKFWKGYFAAAVWHAGAKAWVPTCMEITEHAELDLRGVFARGQVWRFSKAPKARGKASPLVAKLAETRPEEDVPPTIDIRPCLLHCYHRQTIYLNESNPLPPRTMVSPAAGAPPAALGGAGAPEERVDRETVAKLLQEARKGFSGSGNGNGKH